MSVSVPQFLFGLSMILSKTGCYVITCLVVPYLAMTSYLTSLCLISSPKKGRIIVIFNLIMRTKWDNI